MNVLLLVIDSLRASSLRACGGGGTHTPFLDRLSERMLHFRRAYASECWTLPTHCSLFTGLMPGEHGAHFGSMAYNHATPTLAEILAASGFRTDLVTRNFVFDGNLPGITRGFQTALRPMAQGGAHPFALILALAKPRFRRHIQETGFFHAQHRDSGSFLSNFARSLEPADVLALDRVHGRINEHRRNNQPFFLFCNLYDVHAPYPPTLESILRPFDSLEAALDNIRFPWALAHLGRHAYLQEGFELGERSRASLERRYHAAIELMDRKVEEFFAAAEADGALDDTLVILTSDHGEAFGEHELFLHDASVFNTHLHVPLWIHHPSLPAETVDDVVTTRHLFDLMRNAASTSATTGTLLDADFRAQEPIARAQHFHYPHLESMKPIYRHDAATAITASHKLVRRGQDFEYFDLDADPGEQNPQTCGIEEFARLCREDSLPAEAIRNVTKWLSA